MSAWHICALQAGQAIASPAVTTFAIVMRPSPRARVVQAILESAQIEVSNRERCSCFVSWRNQFGYLPAGSVAALPEPCYFGLRWWCGGVGLTVFLV
jgi:hypothetical protein